MVELLEEYKRLSKMMGKMKGLKVPKKGGYGQQQAINQNLQQMAGRSRRRCSSRSEAWGLQNMLKQLEGQDLGQMQQMMGKMMKGGKMPPGMGF